MKFGKRTQEFKLPNVMPPVQHTPELEHFRAANLVEVSRIVQDAPEIGALALARAQEICEANHLDLNEIRTEVSMMGDVA